MPIHSACLNLAPQSSHQNFYQALVCGARLQAGEFHSALQTTGLLHLIVVSGSHLLFLERAMRRNLNDHAGKDLLILLFLGFYCLAAKLDAPVLRAFVGIMLQKVNLRFKFFWSSAQLTLFSGITVLALFPELLRSYSLLLSWGASLALCSSEQNLSSFSQNLRVYLVLFPILLPLAAPHPASVILNWMMAPILGALLFPACLLSFFLPFLDRILDPAWVLLEKFLVLLASQLETDQISVSIPLSALWVYLACLHIGLQLRAVNKRRLHN